MRNRFFCLAFTLFGRFVNDWFSCSLKFGLIIRFLKFREENNDRRLIIISQKSSILLNVPPLTCSLTLARSINARINFYCRNCLEYPCHGCYGWNIILFLSLVFLEATKPNQCEHVGWLSIIILVFWPKIHILLPFCDNMTLYMTRLDNITSIFISYDNVDKHENVTSNWYIAFRKNISANNEFILTFRYIPTNKKKHFSWAGTINE